MFTADDVRFEPQSAPTDFHFIQGKRANLLDFWPQFPKAGRFLLISYDAPIGPDDLALRPGQDVALFWPKSTWAEGRNLAWEAASRLGEQIDYAFFLDDDIGFRRGNYQGFVAAVHALQPLLAAPLVPRTASKRFQIKGAAVQAGAIHDEQLLVFHRSALDDPFVWPLERRHESLSWHVACMIQQFFIHERFPQKLAQFNDFVISNEGHVWSEDGGGSSYQYEQDFEKVREAAFEAVSDRLGQRPDTANHWFRRLPPRSLAEVVRRAYWRRLGLRRGMAQLSDRHGRFIGAPASAPPKA